MTRAFVGVDPGKNGGIAVVTEDGLLLTAGKMPETDKDLLDMFVDGPMHWIGSTPSDVRAVIERVHASPQMGVTSAFTFGRGYGALRMALLAAKIPFDDVTPQAWQRELRCSTGGVIGRRGADKNVTKARAQELFPSERITHAIADAVLIAEYARRLDRAGIAPGRATVQQKKARKQRHREEVLF